MATPASKLNIDNTVFDSFKTLTSSVDAERFNGSIALLKHLNRSKDEEKLSKERDYTLNRLVRGLGASTFASRAGFFSTLVGYLTLPENASIAHAQIIEVLNKQLKIGKTVADKEDSDALIGHILLCGALLRSNRLVSETNENIAECVKILVHASKNKLFHASLAYKFLVDLLDQLSAEQFSAAVWPTLEPELRRSWERQSCNTLHFLFDTHRKYPSLVDEFFVQKAFKTPEILTPLSHKHLGRIFWGTTSMSAIAHPSYDALSRFLLAANRKNLINFWTAEINETLAAPNKIKEVVTLKLLTDFLNETEKPLDCKTILKLVTPRFVKMIVASLKALKLQKHDVLVTFYVEFFEALNKYFETIPDDQSKVQLLQRFLLRPGTLMLEKYLPQNAIRQLITKLGRDGVADLFETYKSVFLGSLAKDKQDPTATWLNVERLHACQMMQYLLGQKNVQSDKEWITAQLKFLLTVGLFHVNESGVAVSKDNASPSITKDLWLNARSVFYASLQLKSTSLAEEKNVLLSLVEHVNEIVSKKKGSKYLKDEWTAESQSAWKQMYENVHASKKEKKLTMVFQILFLHMGLQLFREADMAQVAIVDLVKCMEKTKQVKKAHKKALKNEGQLEEEPEWIEVVVDLFLHLLSQNTSFLRNVVSNVFPHLCPELTLTAIHQILAVLDMKDGKNPLSSSEEKPEDSDGDDDDSDVDMKSDDESEAEDKEDDDEEEDDDDEDIQEDEGTVTDQLRNAVSNALGRTLPNDDDADSVDLNDMDDAEAERLDKALSSAFQLIRGANGQKSKKKSKKDRTTVTTVMHFRIRVIDLIEIYLKTNPALSITLEIMLALFNMIEYCTDGDLKALSDKIDKVLARLLALRQFENVNDVTIDNLRDLLKSLVEKKVNPIKLSSHNKLLSKSFGFLISNASRLPDAGTNDSILQLIQSYASEFIRTRNPKIQNNLLQDIFRIRWNGVWSVAQTFAEQGLQVGRAFRRTQSLELLTLVYKNHGFIKTDVTTFNGINGKIEKSLNKYLLTSVSNAQVSSNEFTALSALLVELHKTQKVVKEIKSQIKWTKVGEQVQHIRKQVVVESLKSYSQLCKALGLVVVKKVDVAPKQNGHANGGHAHSDDEEETAPAVNGSEKLATKRKATSNGDSKKEKKLKREERMRIASDGLDGMSFATAALNSDDEAESEDEEQEDEAESEVEADSDDEAEEDSDEEMEEDAGENSEDEDAAENDSDDTPVTSDDE